MNCVEVVWLGLENENAGNKDNNTTLRPRTTTNHQHQPPSTTTNHHHQPPTWLLTRDGTKYQAVGDESALSTKPPTLWEVHPSPPRLGLAPKNILSFPFLWPLWRILFWACSELLPFRSSRTTFCRMVLWCDCMLSNPCMSTGCSDRYTMAYPFSESNNWGP